MKLYISILLILLSSFSAFGQLSEVFKTRPQRERVIKNSTLESEISDIVQTSQEYFLEGEKDLKAKAFSKAKSKFNDALKIIETSRIQIESNTGLKNHYEKLKNKINQYEVMYELNAPNPSDFDPDAKTAAPKPPDIDFPINSLSAGTPPKQLKTGVIPIILKHFNDTLHDPYSAKYLEWSKPTIKFLNNKPYWFVAVRLRAKNLFGAYRLGLMTFYIKNNRIVDTEAF